MLNHKCFHSLKQEQQHRRHAKQRRALNSEDLLLSPFISQANLGLDKLPIFPRLHFGFHYSTQIARFPQCVFKFHKAANSSESDSLFSPQILLQFYSCQRFYTVPRWRKTALEKPQGSFCFGFVFAKNRFVTRSIPLAVPRQERGVER